MLVVRGRPTSENDVVLPICIEKASAFDLTTRMLTGRRRRPNTRSRAREDVTTTIEEW